MESSEEQKQGMLSHVPSDHGVHGVIPVVLDDVQVRVTDSAVQNLYCYIIVSGAPAYSAHIN